MSLDCELARTSQVIIPERYGRRSCARSCSQTCGPTPRTPSAEPSSATRSPICGARGSRDRAVRVRTRCKGFGTRGRRPAPPLRRPLDALTPARARALRHRARPLRPDRLAGARGSRSRARADRPRQRHASPAHAHDHRRGTQPDRPAGRGIELARAGTARPPSAGASAGAALRRRPRALLPDPPGAGARGAGTRSRAAIPAVRRRPGPRDQALRPGARRWRARSMSSCSRSAASIPPARRCGSTPSTPC